MKWTFTRLLICTLTLLAGLSVLPAAAQTGVLDPNDTIRVYDPAHPPAIPAGGTLAKWVKTNRLDWNTSSFKCYYYNGLQFRLKFPKSYTTAADGKTYPMYVFFHGVGEAGTIYDNEYSLYHGGQVHMNAVDNGTFDGFLFYPQSSAASGGWSQSQIDLVVNLINNYFVPQIKVDINRIVVNGLSGGGSATWLMAESYPKIPAAILPMSSSSIQDQNYVQSLKWTPIWLFQGGLDNAPAPATSQQLVNAYNNAGGDLTYTLYTTLGHGTWDSAWAEPNHYPYMLAAYKQNPWVLTGRSEFCPSDAISATIGVTAGFDGYQWKKNDTVISGATSNSISVTTVGTYACRILRGTTWSAWSPTPVVIKIKAATVSPNISVYGLASNVLPAPDGSTSVSLFVPTGYTSYVWARVDSAATLSGTTNILTGATPGQYAVKVTEQYGCSSSFSNPFTVINANGPNAPSAPTNLSATTLSQTSVKLAWNENPSPAYLETQFEVYQGTAAAGPFKLIGFSNALVDTFQVNGLQPKSTYFWKVRAINNTAGSAATSVATATTLSDTIAPTAPVNLRTGLLSTSTVQLLWDSATDNVGVTAYDIYINGQKSYSTNGTTTSFTVYNLTEKKSYVFAVKARDYAGNVSPFSNQVSGAAIFNGLTYTYYQGAWNNLPDFNSLTPAASGTVSNITLDNRLDETNFGFVWKGYIYIPVTGTYTFQTSSDDGSALYIDQDYSASATKTVNNDGLHGTQSANSTAMTLTQGVHKFVATFFQLGGGYVMNVNWMTPQTNGQFVAIPDSAFTEKADSIGPVPNAPSGLTATATAYNKVGLSWTNNSAGLTATEVYRGTTATGAFTTIGRAVGSATSFIDSTASAATTYYYQVKAINGNGSSKYNGQDSAALVWKYYETGSLSVLPNFSTLTPNATGTANTIGITFANRGSQWASTWTGYINIPTTGTYTFYTSSDDGSALYIDGNLVVNNDGLHGTQEASGTIATLSAGLHTLFVSFFQNGGDQVMNASWQGPGIAKAQIPASALGKPPVSVTTPSLPGAPLTPTSFTAAATSSKIVVVSWKDSATVAGSYKLYRSATTNTNYVLLATLPGYNGVSSYVDTSLFPNSTYYYKLYATNNGGNSPYTSEKSITTPDSIPAFSPIANVAMRWGTTVNVNVAAVSPVNDVLSLTFSGLPSFATVTSTGNGTATVSLASTQSADQGNYSITATATDQHGGVATKTFTVNVNNIYNPVISGIANVAVAEGATSTLTLTATNQNTGDSTRWRFSGLPAFVTPVIAGSTVTLKVAPGYSDAGTYTAAAVAYGGVGGVDSETFAITVSDVNPNKTVYVAFNNGTKLAGTPWNNTAKAIPTLNDVFGPFKDSTGATSTVGIKVTSNWQSIGTGSNTSGVSTGNNSGVYPDVVISQAYWSSTVGQTFNLTGLDTAKNRTYTLTFFGSRGSVTDNRTTNYTVNGQTVSLNAAGNYLNTVSLTGLKAASDGTLGVTLKNGTGSSYSYLNAMVITSVYNDSTAPAAPRNLAVGLNATGTVANVTWTAAAYNDTAYQVFRSTDSVTFTLLGKTAAHAAAYNDSTIAGNVTYYYKVAAVNKVGTSAFAGPVKLVVPNKAPVLTAIPDQTVKGDTTLTVNVSATYTAGDSIWLTAINLPGFASFTDLGHGAGKLVFAPSNSQVGVYGGIVVKASDNYGGVAMDTLKLTVKDKTLTSTYINFNQTNAQASPWNNFNSAPGAGAAVTNALDENGVASGITTTLVEAWSGTSAVGATTGNNSGVYPDNVLLTTYYDNSGSTKHIKLTGLKATNKYNLVFFASRVASDTRITYFSVGSDSVALNVSGNTTTTVQLNGKSPDSTGAITISVSKASAAPYAYINALVIQSYTASTTPLDPSNLTALATGKTTVKLGWSDRSDNEKAFEIWRAPVVAGTTNLAGSLALIDTVAANVTVYADNSVAAGANYVYQVRAKGAGVGVYSGYSNTAYAATLLYQVYMNFNRTNPAGTPWNNTNSVPNPGAVFANLLNDQGNQSGINLTVVNNFSGDNPYGVNTGNNSGIYPDNVIDKTWWTDAGTSATIKIDGLNQAMTYNFVFFASRSATDTKDRTTQYTINGNSAYLNATNNTTQTTQLNNVTPDANGAVYITIQNAATSTYGYLGALVIQAANSFNAPIVVTGRAGTASGLTTDLTTENKATIFPNPFLGDVQLSLSLSQAVEKLGVRVVDMSGRAVYAKQFSGLQQGVSTISLGLNGGQLGAGVYFVEVFGLPGGKVQTFRILKK